MKRLFALSGVLACLVLGGCATDGYMLTGIGYGLGYSYGDGGSYGTISIQTAPVYPYYSQPYYGYGYASPVYYPPLYPYGYYGRRGYYAHPYHYGYGHHPYYRSGMVAPPAYHPPGYGYPPR